MPTEFTQTFLPPSAVLLLLLFFRCFKLVLTSFDITFPVIALYYIFPNPDLSILVIQSAATEHIFDQQQK